MTHDTEHETPTTPLFEDLDNTTDLNRKKSIFNKLSRRQLLLSAGGLALATALTVGIGVGVNAKNDQGREIPVAAQPGGETTSTPESNTSAVPVSAYEALNQNGGPFSAEELSKLSPEELTALFQIKASEFTTIKNGKMPTAPADVATFGQEYTKVLAQRIEAWENAGCTKDQWAPYGNKGPGVFSKATAAKYNPAISKGILGYENASTFLETSLNRCDVMFMDKQTVYNKVDVVDGSVNAISQGDQAISVTVLYRYTDNYDLRKTLGDKPEYAPGDFTFKWGMPKTIINSDGAIVFAPDTLSVTSTK